MVGKLCLLVTKKKNPCYTCGMRIDLHKTGLRLFVSIVVAGCFSSCWYMEQAGVFLGERARAKPLSALAKKKDAPEGLKLFLARVEAIRQFSTQKAGMSPTRNYTRYVAVDKEYVADVVQACAADSFTRYYWRYPFLGALPYKGFYDKAKAEKEAAKLRAAGLDVIVRPVDAFSSLGFFSDPLYSFMLDYDEDVLAETILHESSHASLFVKGADQFNEEFATFTGRKACELYMNERYGSDSQELARRRSRENDNGSFVAFLRETALQLESVYADASLSRDAVLEAKKRILEARAVLFAELAPDLFENQGYARFDMRQINNAYLDMYRLYEEDLSLYRRWYEEKASGSLPEFVASLRTLAKTAKKDIKSEMARLLAAE